MLERIDVYGIDTPDLERVAKVFEMKFIIEFEAENDSEMGECFLNTVPIQNETLVSSGHCSGSTMTMQMRMEKGLRNLPSSCGSKTHRTWMT